MGLGRNGFREYEFEQDVPLSRKAERAKRDYEFALLDIFKGLKTRDPEVDTSALELWDNVIDAARFYLYLLEGSAKKHLWNLSKMGEEKMFWS